MPLLMYCRIWTYIHSFIVGEHAFEFAVCVTSTLRIVDFGRSGQTRTGDVLIPNQVHCQLCYTPNFKTCIRSSFLIYAGSAGGSRTPRSPGYGPGEKPLLNRAWSRRRVTIPLPAVYKTAALPTWATPAKWLDTFFDYLTDSCFKL